MKTAKEKNEKLEKGMRRKNDGYEYRPYLEIDGKVIRKSFYGKSQTEAKKKCNKFLTGVKTEKQKNKLSGSTTPTVYEIAKSWIDTYKKGVVSAGSYKNYCTYLERYIKQSNIDKPVHQVTSDDLQIFFTNISWMSASAINYPQIIVKNVVRIAVKNNYIADDPMEGVTVMKQPQAPVIAFKDRECGIIFNYTYEHYFGLPIRMWLSEGFRPGELCALQWDIIDIEKRMIRICRTLSIAEVGFEIRDTTKTGEERVAYIHDAILDDLTLGKFVYEQKVKLSKKQRTPPPSPFVFTYNGTHLSRHAMEYHYKQFFKHLNETLKEDEKVEYKSPNKCRTTFATNLLEDSGNIRVAQVALGHRNVKTTQRYTTPDFEDIKTGVEKLRYKNQ